MDRREFIKLSAGTAALAAFCSCSTLTAESTKKKRPNVILLLVDDMGYGDIAAHGNPVIKTPNFDKLHGESARFTNFAVSPSCSPTRAALLTGKHEFLSGVTHTIIPMREMSLKSTIIPQLFKKKGYKTGLFGKWHLSQAGEFGPWHRGFDETLTVPKDSQKSHYNPTLLKNQVETKFKGYRTDILFTEAMDFIKRHKNTPFFCYLPTYSPHSPHKVPQKYSKPYEVYVKDRKNENQRVGSGFLGMVANVDQNLGRLRTHLRSLGLEDNTLLIVINDNGGTGGIDIFNAGCRGVKGTIWSGGTRAYSFWKWGDKFAPGDRSQMSGHVDVLPTLADLCGHEISEDLQKQLEGDSLRPVLEDANARLEENRMQVHSLGRWSNPLSWREHKYAAVSVRWKDYTLVRIDPCENGKCNTCSAIRNRIPRGRFKLSYTNNPDHHAIPAPGQWSLYDIATDPFQRTDIADKHPEITKRMANHYEAWWKKVEVVLTERWKE